MKQKLMILFMVMSLLLMLLPGSVLAANSGIDGDINWEFTDDGTLIFSGNGNILSASQVGSWRWHVNIDEVKKIIINNGISVIEQGAFRECSNLVSVTIPDSVTTIEDYVFLECRNLTDITIPNTVTSIGQGVFEKCSSLKKMVIPNSVNSIGMYIFKYCKSLESVNLSNSISNIPFSAFDGCTSLTNIDIPNGVTLIAEQAFWDCENLVNVNIPISVTTIENDAFWGCKKLRNVYYAGTQSDWDKISITMYNNYLVNTTIHFSSKVNSNSDTNNSNIKIMLNGNPLSFSQAPYMANNTTMVPMRVIFEALGADVNYDSASQKITATKGDTAIELVLGQKTAKKNGENITLDAAAVTQNGNTMVPLRFVAEALQAQVNWDGATQTVSISSEN